MWGSLEGAQHETFEVLYFQNSEWFHHLWIQPKRLSALKDYQNNFSFLFPKDAEAIKFVAKSSHPCGNRKQMTEWPWIISTYRITMWMFGGNYGF